MINVNILKPKKENISLFLLIGFLFFSLGIIDFCLNNFYGKNITSFLPRFMSFFTPLIFGRVFAWGNRAGAKEWMKGGPFLVAASFVTMAEMLLLTLPRGMQA